MFEETGVQNFHVDRIRGRVKLETIQATYAAGTSTLDAANSSPGVTLSGAGTLTLTYKPGTFVQFMQPIATTVGAVQITGAITASNAGAGTATMLLSATPANGERIYITMLIGRTG